MGQYKMGTMPKGKNVAMQAEVSEVMPPMWLCEANIWTSNWMYLGTIQATTESRLLVLNATEFQDIVSKFHTPSFDPTLYGEGFVKALNASDKLSDVGSRAM